MNMMVFYGCECLVWTVMAIVIIGEIGCDSLPLQRQKREARQCKDKYKILGTHSACQPRSAQANTTGVNITAADIQQILREHNNYRATVTPPAANMMKMYWDTEVASIAQAWAETCSFTHDKTWNRYIPGRLSIGQNIGKGYFTWTACIKAWYDEVKYFSYASGAKFELVGHYTQLVWGNSNKLGCGVANCGKYNFHVCNYAPAGNIGNHTMPYKSAQTSCQDCSGNCVNKLCDCKTKSCENEGTLDPGTCNCKCKFPDFQIQPTCQLACYAVKKQPYMCGTGSYVKSGCREYAGSVPSACPLLCESCPYAGYNYTEKGVELVENSANSRHGLHSFSLTVIFLIFVSI